MLLCTGCCYALDVAMHWILLCTGYCYALDVAMHWMLLCTGCCYVLDVAMHVKTSQLGQSTLINDTFF